MTDQLYDLMNWADVEEIVYSESEEPGRILGPHLTEKGLLIQSFIPTAKKIEVKIAGEKTAHEMELADEDGFFAVLIPAKRAWEKKLPHYTLHITYDNDTEEETADAYSFASWYTEEDLKKFDAGIHYTIYEKMGAHPDVVDGVEGVHFSVWAPNAMRVSVVGDFNLWDGRRHMMNRLGESGIFELFVPHLSEGALYKYEIKNRRGEPMLKIDPYANGFELRPANASIVRDLNDFAWEDGAWMEAQKKADSRKKPMSIYEVHLGSFMRKPLQVEEDGTPVNGSEFYNYREIAPKLASYVKDMGYTHVELMPVMEHPFDGSWGYQVTGYYAPTSRFGTPEDFMYFMDYMHQHGIAVILDWVPAHFPRDSWGMAAYDGTALYEHLDPRQGAHPHWGTLIYNYGRPQVSNFLIANAMFWADKFHADGIRMDAVASMLYLDYGKQDGEWIPNMYGGNENLEAVEFLKHLNSMFKKRFPGAVLIAEESTAWPLITAPVEADGMGFDYKWNMGWMNDFLSYMKCDPYFRKNNYGELTFSMMYNYSEDFILVFSHDEVVHGKGSMLGKMPGETFEEKARNLRTAYGFFAGHPGKKLLFMGQEFAQNDEWSEERELEWNLLEYPVHAQMQSYVKDLNALYNSHPALYELDYNPEGFEWINCSYQELSLLMFVRKTKNPEETLLFVCNFDNMEHQHFRVGVPFMCEAKALMTSDDKKYGGNGLVLKHARKAKKMEWDDREYSVEVDIPSMSVSIYQLTPAEDPEEKAKREREEKAAAKAAREAEKAAEKAAKEAEKAKKAAARAEEKAKKAAEQKAKKAAAEETAIVEEKSAEPNAIVEENGAEPTAVVEESGAEPTAVVEEGSAEPTAVVKHEKKKTSIVKHEKKPTGVVKHEKKPTAVVKHEKKETGVVKHEKRTTSVVKSEKAGVPETEPKKTTTLETETQKSTVVAAEKQQTTSLEVGAKAATTALETETKKSTAVAAEKQQQTSVEAEAKKTTAVTTESKQTTSVKTEPKPVTALETEVKQPTSIETEPQPKRRRGRPRKQQ